VEEVSGLLLVAIARDNSYGREHRMTAPLGICGECSEIAEVVDWNGQVLDADEDGERWTTPDPSTGMIDSGLPEWRLAEHKKLVEGIVCPGVCPGSRTPDIEPGAGVVAAG
jgi:hypothetical protein